jgi:hypothetical protein
MKPLPARTAPLRALPRRALRVGRRGRVQPRAPLRARLRAALRRAEPRLGSHVMHAAPRQGEGRPGPRVRPMHALVRPPRVPEPLRASLLSLLSLLSQLRELAADVAGHTRRRAARRARQQPAAARRAAPRGGRARRAERPAALFEQPWRSRGCLAKLAANPCALLRLCCAAGLLLLRLLLRLRLLLLRVLLLRLLLLRLLLLLPLRAPRRGLACGCSAAGCAALLLPRCQGCGCQGCGGGCAAAKAAKAGFCCSNGGSGCRQQGGQQGCQGCCCSLCWCCVALDRRYGLLLAAEPKATADAAAWFRGPRRALLVAAANKAAKFKAG